jgi:hypothetical protein
MKVIPANADRIEKREKHNKYILATHGPLSRFAVRIGYVPPQKYVKHYAPSGLKFLRIPGYPHFDLDQARYFATPLTGGIPPPVRIQPSHEGVTWVLKRVKPHPHIANR